MTQNIKVFVEDNSPSYRQLFDREEGYESTTDIKEADLVCFIGGADVDPDLYLEENTSSFVSADADFSSLKLAVQASRLNLPAVGICRGGQFLNVTHLNGSMKQHIEGHDRGHLLMRDGVGYPVTSSHHQEMVPDPSMGSEVIKALDGTVEAIVDCGVLCYQPHPEWVQKDHPCSVLFFQLLKEMLHAYGYDNLE